VAGAFALASGAAYLAYLLPFEGRDAAITAWNLLIIPTALYLGGRLKRIRRILKAACRAREGAVLREPSGDTVQGHAQQIEELA